MTTSAQRVSPELAELLTSLGVDADRAHLSRKRATGTDTFLVLPSLDRPQLLVPFQRGAGAIVRERRTRGAAARLRNTAVAMGLGSAAAPWLPVSKLTLEDDALRELLGEITGVSGADHAFSAGIMVGPPRANRKPVLRIFSGNGDTWGYAKVGINDLTNSLIRREVVTLTEANTWSLTTLRVPQILYAGQFHGRELLATSPLAVAGAGPQATALPVEPTRELFSIDVQRDVPLRAAPGMAPPSVVSTPETALVESLAERLLALIGDELIPLGAAHGDWTPWNMAWTPSDGSGSVLETWDWERASTGVPQGHDVVHFEASKVRLDNQASAEFEFLRALPARMAACGIDPALTSRLLSSYLVTIGRRYAADLALDHVAPLARRLDWVTGLLGRELDRMEFELLGNPNFSDDRRTHTGDLS